MFEEMAQEHDELDKRTRAEIAKYPHGFDWHKGPGGGLPLGWSDSELVDLRPHDWTVIRHVRFYRVPSPRGFGRGPGARRARRPGHARRPSAKRRTGSSSSTSSADPGDDDGPADPEVDARCVAGGA